MMTPPSNLPYTVPAPPQGDYLRVIPLGGLDEVGMNCCLIECNGSLIMIDCGLTFPESEGYGIDIILPDWSYVMERLDVLDGVILTHGHEDHIGALPFFLKEVDVPVYGGRLTLAMLSNKLKEHQLDGAVELIAVEPGDVLDLAPFEVEFVHTNHSVPNAMSISLVTPLGRLVFTGDWKLDQTPVGEPTMDLQRFAEFGREGTLALLGDSTNAGTPGFSDSERTVNEGLAHVLDTAKGRVIIAQFSSNIYRVQSILELAEEFGRKVALLGRSMSNNFQLAQKMGFVKINTENILIDIVDSNKLPDEDVIIVSTGSQAEPRSSLNRLAYGDHNLTKIRSTDTIVMSARVIPGNERGIQNMINNLVKNGARVITPREAPVHASGHAKQEELKLMLNLVRPQHLVPMHGSFRMRSQHAELAHQVGIKNTHLIEDGYVLEFVREGVRVVGRVPVGRVFVDGATGGDIEDVQLRDRKKLAHSGIIIAFAVLDRARGELISGPDLVNRGSLSQPEHALIEEGQRYAKEAIDRLSPDARANASEVSEAIRTSVRRFFRKKLDRKPVVIPIVHEM